MHCVVSKEMLHEILRINNLRQAERRIILVEARHGEMINSSSDPRALFSPTSDFIKLSASLNIPSLLFTERDKETASG